MVKVDTVDKWVRKLDKLIPEPLKEMDKDFEKKIKAILMDFMQELNITSREEFDIQSKVLLKTRLKLEALEARLEKLES